MRLIVSRFAGWLIYFPALPNWVSMFQNSTGGSSTSSFTLQDHTFPVAWFSICRKCPLHSIWTILYLGLHLRSHLPGCFSWNIPYLLFWNRVVSCPGSSVQFLSGSHPMSSWQWPTQVCVLQDSAFQNLGLPRIIAWALVADAEVNLDPFCRLRKMGFLLWLG